jgi:hypothetical protein
MIEKDAVNIAKKRMLGISFVMKNGFDFEFDRAFKFDLIFRHNTKNTDATFQLV